ncbi:MAG: hypothetical protein QW555_03425 [Nitrososphaerota archaeon]
MEEFHGCLFSTEDLYFVEEMLWLRPVGGRSLRIGVLPVTQALWGKISSMNAKQPRSEIAEGRAICYVEARRFVGNIKAPFDLVIDRLNSVVLEKPWVIQTGHGESSWLCEVTALKEDYMSRLRSWDEARPEVLRIINERGVVCFSEPPDYVYAAVGIDCSQLLMVLSDRLEGMADGSVIHVVADYNEGAEKDLEKWSQITGNEVLEFRVEKRLAHALIRKKASF